MNNPSKSTTLPITEATTMSSREIARLTSKQHKHIIVDCEKLNESYDNLGEPKIRLSFYNVANQGNKQYKQYLLTRIQCFDLITGYDTELRIKVNRRWEELEKQQVQPCLPPPASEMVSIHRNNLEVLEIISEVSTTHLNAIPIFIRRFEAILNPIEAKCFRLLIERHKYYCS